ITLLKNTDKVLPLRKGAKVLVAGPTANTMRSLNGGWTLSWQGEKSDLYGAEYNTILEAIQHKIGKQNVVFEAGVKFKLGNPPTLDYAYDMEQEPQIEKAVAAARNVDYIILCLGESSYCETPGNLNTMDLSTNQRKLAKALAKTGKPIILVLAEGRPRVIQDIEPLVKGVIQTYYAGNYGGDALANILWGDVNPSGKLPYTYPRYANSLITYDYKPSENVDKMEGAYNYDAVVSVQWAFGYGLSYTSFKYSNMKVNKASFTDDDEITFMVDVKNTGKCTGQEVVMLYVSDLYASLTPDIRRLRAFTKIELKAGETRVVTLRIKASDLAFVGHNGRWMLEQGDFRAQIGNQTLEINCTKTKEWANPNI
ncbi:MAG: glycoside hydrolase family 3 C-terminal domain-containing protein, partial [Bacteroidales bacterium]